MGEIERLEDLSAAQQEALQAIDKTGMCGFRIWCTLFDMGLVDTNGEYDSLTQEGQALVSDYQQRQSEPRTSANQNKPTYEQLEADNARLRALLNHHGLWVDFNHVAKVLDDIRVTDWLTVHANALGFAIGYFRHLQNMLDGKDNQD